MSDIEKELANKLSADDEKNYMLYGVVGGILLILISFIIFICWRNFCKKEDKDAEEELEGEIGIKVGRSNELEPGPGNQG